MNKTESYCYQKYKSSSNNSCVIKEKNIVGKNLLEGTYFDGDGIPKMIGITKAEYLEYKKLQQENKQLKSILTDLEEWCNDGIKDELIKFDYGTEIIGIPIKIHIASYEMFLDKIQVLKEKYENRRL